MRKSIAIIVGLTLALSLFLMFYASQYTYKLLPASLPSKMATTPFIGWVDYEDPSGRFKVTVPVLPIYSKDRVRNTKGIETRIYNMYVSETEGGSIYLVNVMDYLPYDGRPKLIPSEIVTNMMYELIDSQPNNKLMGFKKTQIEGQEGLEFLIVNKNIQMECACFMLGDTVYLLSMIANIDHFEDANFRHFLNSFKLKK